MKKSAKKVIGVTIIFTLIICTIIFYNLFIKDRYDSDWIIGKSYNEIVERYGPFDYDYGFNSIGGCLYKNESLIDAISRHLLGTDNLYYLIAFDSFGIAYDIFKCDWPGG